MPFDTYSFRIRADHTDGTVSDYSGGEATPLGITAPNITASPQDVSGSYFIELDWQPAVSPSGLTATSYNLQWHGSGVVGQGWTTIPDPTSGMGFNVGQAQTGEFRLQAVFVDGTSTDWGISNTATEGGGLGVPVSASASAASDTEIDVTYSCDPQTANNSPVSYSILYAPYDAPAGSGTLVNLPDLAPGATGTAQITGLTPGVRYDFLVSAGWHGQTQTDEAGGGSANVDATTQGSPPTAAPAAPSSLFASWGVPGQDGVFLHWTNDPDNETGYIIYSYPEGTTFDPSTAKYVGGTPADQTTFDDPNADLTQDVIYAVMAVDGSTKSGPTTAPVAKYQDFTITGAGLKFETGGGDTHFEKKQLSPLDIVRKVLEKGKNRALELIKNAADALGADLSNYASGMGSDGKLVIQGVTDYLTVKGNVAVTINGKTTIEEVRLDEFDLDPIDPSKVPPGGYQLLVPGDLQKLNIAIAKMTTQTYNRNPHDLAAEIEAALEAKALEQANGQ